MKDKKPKPTRRASRLITEINSTVAGYKSVTVDIEMYIDHLSALMVSHKSSDLQQDWEDISSLMYTVCQTFVKIENDHKSRGVIIAFFERMVDKFVDGDKQVLDILAPGVINNPGDVDDYMVAVDAIKDAFKLLIKYLVTLMETKVQVELMCERTHRTIEQQLNEGNASREMAPDWEESLYQLALRIK